MELFQSRAPRALWGDLKPSGTQRQSGGLRKPLKSIASRYCRRHPDQAALRCIRHPPPSSSILIYLHVPSPPIRPLVRSQTSRYECHLTSSIKGSHVSSERIFQVPPYEYFYIIHVIYFIHVDQMHTKRASHYVSRNIK